MAGTPLSVPALAQATTPESLLLLCSAASNSSYGSPSSRPAVVNSILMVPASAWFVWESEIIELRRPSASRRVTVVVGMPEEVLKATINLEAGSDQTAAADVDANGQA